jgi:hypothetical protein
MIARVGVLRSPRVEVEADREAGDEEVIELVQQYLEEEICFIPARIVSKKKGRKGVRLVIELEPEYRDPL